MVTSGADQELKAFAEQAQIPVVTTLMGIGGFSGHHPLWVGMPGMHGTYAANHALLECDLLIGIGARFDDRVTMGRIDKFAKGAKIAHIDIDPAEIGKNVDAYIPIVGDVKRVLQAALDGLPRSRSADWLRRIEDWKRQYPLTFRPSENALKPQWVIRHLYETTGGDAIVTTDVGQHQMWVAQYFRFARPRSFITSGGLGTMGFGFPAALGAQIANPDRLVICVTGTGDFR